MFLGFKSLWYTPSECMYRRADQLKHQLNASASLQNGRMTFIISTPESNPLIETLDVAVVCVLEEEECAAVGTLGLAVALENAGVLA